MEASIIVGILLGLMAGFPVAFVYCVFLRWLFNLGRPTFSAGSLPPPPVRREPPPSRNKV